jgi:hypothetical protein
MTVQFAWPDTCVWVCESKRFSRYLLYCSVPPTLAWKVEPSW